MAVIATRVVRGGIVATCRRHYGICQGANHDIRVIPNQAMSYRNRHWSLRNVAARLAMELQDRRNRLGWYPSTSRLFASPIVSRVISAT